MKIKVVHENVTENEIILRCPTLDDEMLRVLFLLENQEFRLPVQDEAKTIHLIDPKTIYYAESIDDQCFIYLQDCFYQSSSNLIQLEKVLINFKMIRISRSVLVNLMHVSSLKSIFSGRIEIMMDNHEKLIVSRFYSGIFRDQLMEWR